MSNLRWILLFSGFAILFLLYFSGRPRRNHAEQSRPSGRLPEKDFSDAGNHAGNQDRQVADAGAGIDERADAAGVRQESYPDAYASDAYASDAYASDAYAGEVYGQEAYSQDVYNRSSYTSDSSAPGQYDQDAYTQAQSADQYGADVTTGYANVQFDNHVARPSSSHHGVPPIPAAPSDGFNAAESFGPIDPSDLDRPAASGEDFVSSRDAVQKEAALEDTSRPAFTNPISQKIAAFTDKLAIRRNVRATQKTIDRNSTKTNDGSSDKIVLLHVMAPNNGIIDGSLLLEVIESRGYHYGDLDIFHSLHDGKTVFSIAKVVEPGRFDINDISSFNTPGLALILRLPGPVPGDVAFEVMMSEAHELANALGCRVLDSGRSTLSRQTVSHLRESILQYLHRQKYLSKAVS